MIQYLINATAIWLLSLLVFDLWLRKSTHHTYNRVYLIITALLGAFAPLYPASPKVASISPVLSKPMMAFADVKHTITTVASIPKDTFPWATWIMGAYILGIAISCAILLREGILLLRWYHLGEKQTHGDFRLVVTHRNHGPFSVFGHIFISDTRIYTPDELSFILQHEGVHIKRWHFPDKALLLALRSIFWVHPLAWIYYNRLMMIHEYEADDTARKAPRDYAQFLIQQQLTGVTPLLAHSFFHSPLKNRIRMLTAKRTRSWRKASYLLALPAIAAFAMLWINNTTTAHKREKHGNIVTVGANKFEMGLPMRQGIQATTDTIMISSGKKVDAETNDPNTANSKLKEDASAVFAQMSPEIITVTVDSIPVKMNGQPIYEGDGISVKPALSGSSQSLLSVLVKGAQSEFNKLPDGKYSYLVYSMIVDESGRVVYYTTSPVILKSGTFSLSPGQDFEAAAAAAQREKDAHPIPASVQDEIKAAVEQTLDGLVLTPGKLDGKPVITQVDIHPGYQEVVVVKNHRATVAPDR